MATARRPFIKYLLFIIYLDVYLVDKISLCLHFQRVYSIGEYYAITCVY